MSFEIENKVYSLIKGYQSEHQRTPTVRWLKDQLGFKSTRSAKQYIDRLAETGKITKDSTGKICFLTPRGLPILSSIAAGGATVEEQINDAPKLDLSYIFESGNEDFFALKVRGDSMIDAGIHEDDFVIVDRKKEPRVGDIVVGIIDDAWTLKRLDKIEGKYYLKPENSKYSDLIPRDSLKIGGVVINLIRKY